jgi:hypothetical protein
MAMSVTASHLAIRSSIRTNDQWLNSNDQYLNPNDQFGWHKILLKT